MRRPRHPRIPAAAKDMTKKKTARPDLQIPVEAWGTIKSATDKLTWLAVAGACIAARMVDVSFAHMAINIATSPKGVNSQTGLTWRSSRTLADETCMTKSTVNRLLDKAVAAGLLFVVRKGRPGRDGQSTIYRLAMPEARNGPPMRRFERDKRPTSEPKNPENGPSKPQQTDHACPEKRPTSGTHLLRDSISVENKLRAAAEGGADTARGDRRDTSDDGRDSAPIYSAKTATPDQRADALISALADQPSIPSASQQPSRQPAAPAPPKERAARADPEPSFKDVLNAYPADHVGDEARAFFTFADWMAGCPVAQVVEAVAEFVRARRTDDLPTLAEALRIIAQTQPAQERLQ